MVYCVCRIEFRIAIVCKDHQMPKALFRICNQIYSNGILIEGCTCELYFEIGLMLLSQPCSFRAMRRILTALSLSALVMLLTPADCPKYWPMNVPWCVFDSFIGSICVRKKGISELWPTVRLTSSTTACRLLLSLPSKNGVAYELPWNSAFGSKVPLLLV